MKKYWKSLLAVMMGFMMCLGFGSTVSAASYPDVNPGDWYYDYVQDVSDKGLMSGYTDTGKFGPSDKLTRGQFATILWRMEGSPEVGYEGQFPDVTGNEFYGSAVAWASANGIITGYSDTGKFGPNDNINREQMATILYRYDGSPEVDLSSYAGFPDAGSVNGFAQSGIAYAVSSQILTGDNGYLVPQGTVVRAVCATMISRFTGAQGGNGEDGNTDNGGDNTDNGNTEGGNTDSGNTEGGNNSGEDTNSGQIGSPEDPDEAPQIPDIQPWADRNGFVYNTTDAAYTKTINDIKYECSYGGNQNDPEGTEGRWHIWVTDSQAASGSVVIPESIDGIVVDGISDIAFNCNEAITDITIPATVTWIGSRTFNYTEITEYTFQGDVPYGFNGIRPNPKYFTINYPSGAAGWDEFKFVSDYYEPTFVAY